jgi:hypothetical protein
MHTIRPPSSVQRSGWRELPSAVRRLYCPLMKELLSSPVVVAGFFGIIVVILQIWKETIVLQRERLSLKQISAKSEVQIELKAPSPTTAPQRPPTKSTRWMKFVMFTEIYSFLTFAIGFAALFALTLLASRSQPASASDVWFSSLIVAVILMCNRRS